MNSFWEENSEEIKENEINSFWGKIPEEIKQNILKNLNIFHNETISLYYNSLKINNNQIFYKENSIVNFSIRVLQEHAICDFLESINLPVSYSSSHYIEEEDFIDEWMRTYG